VRSIPLDMQAHLNVIKHPQQQVGEQHNLRGGSRVGVLIRSNLHYVRA
jgi:hypothetical protein